MSSGKIIVDLAATTWELVEIQSQIVSPEAWSASRHLPEKTRDNPDL
jgi:hypothetical protein